MIWLDCGCGVEVEAKRRKARIYYCYGHSKFEAMPPRLPGKQYRVEVVTDTFAKVMRDGLPRKFRGKTAIRDAQAYANDLNDAYMMGYRVGWFGMARQGNLFHGPLEKGKEGGSREEDCPTRRGRSDETNGGKATG